MASHYTPDPTILNFAIRKPVEIRLKYDQPIECNAPGRFMFTLDGLHKGMRTFLGRKTVEQIFLLGVKANEPFWIEKRAKDDFTVSRERPENADQRLNRQLTESVAPLKETPKSLKETVPEPEAPRKPAAVEPATRQRTQLEAALCTAVEACFRATEYARSLGYPVIFTSSDIEKMAVSLLIEKREQQNRRTA